MHFVYKFFRIGKVLFPCSLVAKNAQQNPLAVVGGVIVAARRMGVRNNPVDILSQFLIRQKRPVREDRRHNNGGIPILIGLGSHGHHIADSGVVHTPAPDGAKVPVGDLHHRPVQQIHIAAPGADCPGSFPVFLQLFLQIGDFFRGGVSFVPRLREHTLHLFRNRGNAVLNGKRELQSHLT